MLQEYNYVALQLI